MGRFRRALVALGRARESEDDELAYAYYAANGGGEAYDRARCSDAYLQRACSFYRARHLRRMVVMSFMTAGLPPRGRLADWAAQRALGRLGLAVPVLAAAPSSPDGRPGRVSRRPAGILDF
jgi:hypothetical protein